MTTTYVNPHSARESRQKRLEREEAELEAMLKGDQPPEEEEEDEGESQEESTDTNDNPETPEKPEAKEEEDEDEEDKKGNWKKRYSDIRRHEAQLKKKLKELEEENEKLKETTDDTVDEKTVKDWIKKYPDVAAIFKSLADEAADKKFKEAKIKLDEIDERDANSRTKSAKRKILDAHPEFEQWEEDDAFHDWVESQPKLVQDSLYENADDADSVIFVLDKYAATLKKPKVKTKDTSAAESVNTKGDRTSLDTKNGKGKWTESKVAAMSIQEYEKNEAEILKAMKEDPGFYDLSGSAM